MPFEVTCGQCHGALLVEQAGVVVACPTCGAHLAIPADASVFSSEEPVEAESTDAATSSSPAVLPPTEHGVLEESESPATSDPEGFVSHSSPYLNQLASLPASLSTISDAHTNDDLSSGVFAEAPMPATAELQEVPCEVDVETPAIIEEAALPPEMSDPPTVVLPSSAFSALMGSSHPSVVVSPALPVATVMTPPEPRVPEGISGPAQPIQIDLPASTPQEVVSKQLFFYVATYASAVTLVAIYLLYSIVTYRADVLESLPDIEPPMQQGQIGMKTAKPSDDVPRGHVLRLGESQRFGSVRVTPLRITRGPVRFEHLFGDRNAAREPSRPVYKLWIRFENVSQDQEFIPLSTLLVYKRHFAGFGRYKTNNFLVSEEERPKKDGNVYYLFGLPENSEFSIVGQELNRRLAPGETMETFLAAEEALDAVEGEWTWRVFFRKGYHPRSRRGVTTVIDVRFDGSAVIADADGPSPS